MPLRWQPPQAKRNWQRGIVNCLSCTRLEKHSTSWLRRRVGLWPASAAASSPRAPYAAGCRATGSLEGRRYSPPGYCRKPANRAKWPLVKEWLEKSWRLLLVCALLAAATLATFWPQVHHDFINYDDPVYVTLNKHVSTGLSWDNVKWAWTANCASNWHPLTLLSHMLDVQLFGLKAGGHHLVSLLFHTANSLLLLLLLRTLTGSLWRSALVAALFALHPLHVESVAWVSERKDVLSAFFFLLTLLSYTRYAHAPTLSRSHAPRFYALALVAFILGLMSKPMLVTLPFVLLLLDFWPLRRVELPIKNQKSEIKRVLLEKIPFFIISAISCGVTVVARPSVHWKLFRFRIGWQMPQFPAWRISNKPSGLPAFRCSIGAGWSSRPEPCSVVLFCYWPSPLWPCDLRTLGLIYSSGGAGFSACWCR
jgi:hypothetical protein